MPGSRGAGSKCHLAETPWPLATRHVTVLRRHDLPANSAPVCRDLAKPLPPNGSRRVTERGVTVIWPWQRRPMVTSAVTLSDRDDTVTGFATPDGAAVATGSPTFADNRRPDRMHMPKLARQRARSGSCGAGRRQPPTAYHPQRRERADRSEVRARTHVHLRAREAARRPQQIITTTAMTPTATSGPRSTPAEVLTGRPTRM